MPLIRKEIVAMALIGGMVSFLLILDYKHFPTYMLIFLGAVIVADVRKSGKINPYRFSCSWNCFFCNLWMVFVLFFVLNFISIIFDF